jgi:hypothetical protein
VKDLGARGNLLVVLLALTTMLGCGALNASKPTTQLAPGLVATSAVLDFGAIGVGDSVVRSNTIVNNTASPVVLTRAQINQTDFRVTGVTLPLTLAPGQRMALPIVYSPQSGGDSQATVVLGSNAIRSSATFTLRGTAMAGRIKLTPARISFGNVEMGKTQTQSAILSNPGTNSVTVTQAAISGRGFALTGLSLPLTLNMGESATVGVSFTPVSGGVNSGTISLTGITTVSPGKRKPERITTVASNTVTTTLNVPVSGTGMSGGQLAVAPSSLALGSVKIGASQTQSATLTNSGGSPVTITQATVTGRGFRMSGLSFPLTLPPGQRKTFSVTFAPQSAGSASGSITVTSDAPNSTVNVPVSAVAVGAGVLSTSDSSLDFASVAVGSSATQSETLTNSGSASVTISQANVSGTGFRISGLNLPLILSPGQSFTFGAVFTPTSGGGASGSISVVSDASDPTLTISLAGTATVSGQLAVSPSTLNFGNVVVGQIRSLTATLTASGSGMTVSGANMTTSEFTVSGLTLPLTLAAGQSASFTISFKPQASGTASASASFTSNASNPSAVQSLTGSGTAGPQHSVALSWNPSTSSVVGYNVYRGSTTGGPYSPVATMNADTSYTDSSVLAGQTYFYVTTAVDAAGKESANSNQTQAVVPSP